MTDILIIEDSLPILRMLVQVLSEEGYSVATAETTAIARTKISETGFSCILSDRHLPDGDGIDFVTQIRDAGCPSIPLLMTGWVDWEGAVNAINRGQVFKFFVKPLDMKVLKAGVREAMELFHREHDRKSYVREIAEHNDLLQKELDIRDQQVEETQVRLKSSDDEVKRQQTEIERLYAEIQKSYLQSIASLTLAIEAKDQYTSGHSERVYYYCSLIADVLGLPESSRNDLRFAAVLHDIGKIGIPDAILRKEGALSDNERKVVSQHPLLSESILNPLPFLSKVRKIVRQHHEKYDGTGYPDGLKGPEILLESRILTVADAFDAMRSDRPYRKGVASGDALNILQDGAGTHFCPICVKAFSFALSARTDGQGEEGDTFDSEWLTEAFFDLKPPVSAQN